MQQKIITQLCMLKSQKCMACSGQSLLVTRYVTLISSRGPSVHELKAGNRITATQQFRCNNDMKNGNTRGLIITLV